MTSTDFGRILTLLRKEKGLSQKAAAAELGVSQALLSHYERGIRECGLEFVIRVADLYNVSCDYLLGRSAERSGSVLREEDIPEPEDGAKMDSRFKGSLLPTLNKKLISNSVNVLYGMLSRAGSASLTEYVSAYLDLAVYKAFRYVYSANPVNPDNAFSIDKRAFELKVQSVMAVEEMKMKMAVSGIKAEGVTPIADTTSLLMTPEQLYRDYPLFAGSLMNLIRNTEENIKDVLGEK